MSAAVLERLVSAGLSVALTQTGRIGVSPRALITDDLRDLIRSQRDAILAALTEAEPSPEPKAWRELHEAYLVHHWACVTCIAAGLRNGSRCGVGTALWRAYAG